jgi:hypothetical protein
MTGLAETEHIVRGLEAGGVDYVTKPIVIEEMLARIRVHLANARMTQSAQTALDVSGRFLMAVSRQGKIMWATPQAQKLLSDNLGAGDELELPQPMLQWLDSAQKGKPGETAPPVQQRGAVQYMAVYHDLLRWLAITALARSRNSKDLGLTPGKARRYQSAARSTATSRRSWA